MLGQSGLIGRYLNHGRLISASHEALGSALYAAAFNDDVSLAHLLIHRGVNVLKTEGAYGDALQLAAYKGSMKVVGLLFQTERYPQVSRRNTGHGFYGSPLAAAAAAGRRAVVRFLLQWRRNSYVNNTSRRSPLFFAARSGHADIVELLLNCSNVDPNIGDHQRNISPLAVAVKEDHEDVVRALLLREATNVNHVSPASCGKNPLQIASSQGNTSIVRLLLGRDDVDINGSPETSLPAVFSAAHRDHAEIVGLLLARGGSILRDPSSGFYLLEWAVFRGSVKTIEILLESDEIDVGFQDTQGMTALHKAVWYAPEDAVKALLRHTKTSLNCQDLNGRTPLMVAVRKKSVNIVQLLAEGSRVVWDTRDHRGETILMTAVMKGELGILDCILAHCCNPNAQQLSGMTALHIASLILLTSHQYPRSEPSGW
jgi:ankyrin repeat protein